jgi:hypothetical protein
VNRPLRQGVLVVEGLDTDPGAGRGSGHLRLRELSVLCRRGLPSTAGRDPGSTYADLAVRELEKRGFDRTKLGGATSAATSPSQNLLERPGG